jgi:hypothetical protein
VWPQIIDSEGLVRKVSAFNIFGEPGAMFGPIQAKMAPVGAVCLSSLADRFGSR